MRANQDETLWRRKIFGVIDLKGGRAVRAIAGDRDRYQPVRLADAPDGDAIRLARGYCDWGVGGLYIADLDAICHGSGDSLETLGKLLRFPVPIWCDRGLRGFDDVDHFEIKSLLERRSAAAAAAATGAHGRIAGEPSWDIVWIIPTEKLDASLSVSMLPEELPPNRETPANSSLLPHPISLRWAAGIDLRDGALLCREGEARGSTPSASIAPLWAAGFTRFCVIDLAAVGTGKGPTTEEICREIRSRYPDAKLLAGGGGRGIADFQGWWECGCDAVLSATWLQAEIAVSENWEINV